MLACLFVVLAGAVRADEVAWTLRDGANAPSLATTWNSNDFEWSADDPATSEEPLSPTKAVLYSLLLPGLGDWKLGHRDRATAFFAVEGVIWASFAWFQVQGGDLEDEYQSLAVQFGGVSRTGHSDEFYATLRDYDNSDDYESVIKTDGRFEYLRALSSEELEQYFIDHRVDDYEPWLWESTERRLQYSEQRSASKTAYRRADYMIAAAAANRVVSAVFAYAAARSAAQHEVGLNVDMSPRGVALMLTKSF
jgi:hypothetical protein